MPMTPLFCPSPREVMVTVLHSQHDFPLFSDHLCEETQPWGTNMSTKLNLSTQIPPNYHKLCQPNSTFSLKSTPTNEVIHTKA